MNICHHMFTLSTQLHNRSFHVVERTRRSSKCQKMRNAHAKHAKLQFFSVKYANLWGFCCCRHRGCLGSPILGFDFYFTSNCRFIFLNYIKCIFVALNTIFQVICYISSYMLRNVNLQRKIICQPLLFNFFCSF